MLTRRSLLSSILVACAGPAIVRADSLMKIVVPKQDIITPWFGFDPALGADDFTVEVFVHKDHLSDVKVTRGLFARSGVFIPPISAEDRLVHLCLVQSAGVLKAYEEGIETAIKPEHLDALPIAKRYMDPNS